MIFQFTKTVIALSAPASRRCPPPAGSPARCPAGGNTRRFPDFSSSGAVHASEIVIPPRLVHVYLVIFEIAEYGNKRESDGQNDGDNQIYFQEALVFQLLPTSSHAFHLDI